MAHGSLTLNICIKYIHATYFSPEEDVPYALVVILFLSLAYTVLVKQTSYMYLVIFERMLYVDQSTHI